MNSDYGGLLFVKVPNSAARDCLCNWSFVVLLKFLCLHSSFWTWTLSLAQGTLELKALRPQPPQELMWIESIAQLLLCLSCETIHSLSLSFTKSASSVSLCSCQPSRTPLFFNFSCLNLTFLSRLISATASFPCSAVTAHTGRPLTSRLGSAWKLIPHYYTSLSLPQLHWETLGPQTQYL